MLITDASSPDDDLLKNHKVQLDIKDAELEQLRRRIGTLLPLEDQVRDLSDQLARARAKADTHVDEWTKARVGLKTLVGQFEDNRSENFQLRREIKEAERREAEARVAEKAADAKLVTLDQL